MTENEAIRHLEDLQRLYLGNEKFTADVEAIGIVIKVLEQQPESEIKPIGYRECSNAMLKMWMDNVLTDGEYNRIMDKLNAKWEKILESEEEE